jgi:hypothetical protein
MQWQQFWDADAEQHFYFNVSTGKKMWREPPTPFNPAVCFVGDKMVDVLVAIHKLQAVARLVTFFPENPGKDCLLSSLIQLAGVSLFGSGFVNSHLPLCLIQVNLLEVHQALRSEVVSPILAQSRNRRQASVFK